MSDEGGWIEMLLLVALIFLLDVKSITAAVKNEERWQKAAEVASLAAIKLRNKYS